MNIKQFIYQKYCSLKTENLSFGKNCGINKKTIFEGYNFLGNNVVLKSSSIGIGTYISARSSIICTKIGRFCAIGNNVQTCLGLHPTKEFVSIHPAFFSTHKQAGFTFVEQSKFKEHKYIDKKEQFVVSIGNDVWIGNNVSIMDGVKVSDGAIIGNGAIVTKDVKPYEIVAGIPARKIGQRFNDSEIKILLELEWWNYSMEKIKSLSHLFNDSKNINVLKDAFKTE